MIRHYEGELGNFDYDDEEFEVLGEHISAPYLHYKGKGLSVNLPKGCINTKYLFKKCKIPNGFTLGDFDTSNVINMSYMFSDCDIPKGFSLGDKFDTSNVIFMRGMFSDCDIPKGFSLGDKFDTSNVINMSEMFCGSTIPDGFSLGDKFNLSSVIEMIAMFFNCKLPPGAPNEQNPLRVINWLKSRESKMSTSDHNETEEEKQLNAAYKFIEKYFIEGEKPLGYKAINQMRLCGYDDAIIRQAMIKAIDNLMQESSEKSSDMTFF